MTTDDRTAAPADLPDENPQRRREYSGAGSTLGLAMLIIVVVALGVWYFEFRDEGGGGADDGYGITGLPDGLNPTGDAPAASEGRAAPNFVLPGLDGGETALADLRGGYVLLNFWASWCGPCRAETPELRDFAEAHPGSMTVVGVNIQEPPDIARDFIDDFGVRYPVLLDRDGDVTQAYRLVGGPPMTVLIDPAGVIVEIVYGQLGQDDLDRFAAMVAG
jgi:thiol-disulfide isomerase/thioredoxin